MSRYRLICLPVCALLAASLVLAPVCQAETIAPKEPTGTRIKSILKICKVAGKGVKEDSDFSFVTQGATGSVTTTVPAGPAPGGWCKVVDAYYPTGSTVTVTELITDTMVTDIIVAPESAGEGNIATGSAKVALGPGVTEVTFVNERRNGYIEICKSGDVKGSFDFRVDGVKGIVTVPAGACSPALEVPAGKVNIVEIGENAQVMECRTLPANRQLECPPDHNLSVVLVEPGDISTQTIAIIVNRPRK